MNYIKIYNSLVEKAQARDTLTTFHVHHIKPKHVGGGNESSNLVKLTVREHWIAHKLLYKIYGRWQDKLACNALKGELSDISKEVCRQNGLEQVRLNKGIHSQTKEERSEFGKRVGQWCKDNPEVYVKAGLTKRNSKSFARARARYIVIDAEGREFESSKEAAEFHNISANVAQLRSARGTKGWSRRLKD